MSERRPIETAPRDGTLIIVGHDDAGEYRMRWGAIQKNAVFAPGVVGMWLMDGGGVTWTDAHGMGPSYWRPLAARTKAPPTPTRD